MRIIRLVLILFLLVLVMPGVTWAEEATQSALVINQVRGKESCCQSGDAAILTTLVEDPQIKNLPLSWALRFDTLTDTEFREKVKALPKSQPLGILLEITPKLASESGVTYKGDQGGNDWYSARNAFLIGYTQDERKKLIDVVFSAFYQNFAYYPTFTVAWMIDSWSLEYIRNTYGVRVHEITREQFETDSYTLYGGWFNAAYFPFREHPLLPAATSSTALDLLLVRQTVSDLRRNYGSLFSYYTSQPNDYLTNPRQSDFNYFVGLISEMLSHKNGLMVLGLENSKEWEKYKDEYLRQLQYLVESEASGKVKVLSPYAYYQLQKERGSNQPIFLASGTFPQSGVLWYFSSQYRARVEIIAGKAVLTDLRIYGEFADPYRQTPAGVDRAYWILPYVIDGSQEFVEIGPKTPYSDLPVRSDSGVDPFGIELTNEPIVEVKNGEGSVILSGTNSQIIFQPGSILLEGVSPAFRPPVGQTFSQVLQSNTDQYVTFRRHPRFFLRPGQETGRIELGWENQRLEQVVMAQIVGGEKKWEIIPQKLTQTDVDKLALILQPDKGVQPFDPQTSVFFWHNQEAIAGRNPIRLYVVPLTITSRPARLQSFTVTIKDNENIRATFPADLARTLSPFLVDFTATVSGSGRVTINADGNIIAGVTGVRFYADCSRDILVCVKTPEELRGYLKIILRERGEQYLQKIKQVATDLRSKALSQIQQHLPNFPKLP